MSTLHALGTDGVLVLDADDTCRGTVPAFQDIFHPTDNCANSTITYFQTPTAGTMLPPGDYDALFRGTDCRGNLSQCVFTVRVRDHSAPTILCPPDATVECGESTDPLALGF